MTRRVRVGDVLRLERTRITPDPAATYRQIGIYSWGKGIIENEAISSADLSKVTYYRFPAGALMLSNIQAWEAAIAVSEDRHSDFIATQRFLPYVPITSGEVDVTYLLHFFLSEPGIALIRKASPGTVTRNRTLGMKAFEDMVVPLPSIDEQVSIAMQLGSILKVASQTDVAANGRGIVVEALRERIVYADPDVPLRTLGEFLTETIDQVSVNSNATYPSAGVRNRGRGVFTGPVIASESTKYSALRRIHSRQIIYSKLKAFEAAIAVVPIEYEGFHTSHEFPTFMVNEVHADVVFLSHLFATRRFTELLAGASKEVGARRERLSPEDFLSLEIPLPDLLPQQRMANQLEALRKASGVGVNQLKISHALPQAARNEVFSKLV